MLLAASTGVAAQRRRNPLRAVRGLNAYSKVPIAIIVGRNRPSNIALEMATEALYMHNPNVKTLGRYHADPKQGRPWLEAHPDPLMKQVQDVIRSARSARPWRVRAFDRTPETVCRVHVRGKDEFRDHGLQYRLVKFKRSRTKSDGIRGTYSEHAIVRAGWDQARLEQLMRCRLVSFRLVGLQELQQEAHNANLRAFDGR